MNFLPVFSDGLIQADPKIVAADQCIAPIVQASRIDDADPVDLRKASLIRCRVGAGCIAHNLPARRQGALGRPGAEPDKIELPRRELAKGIGIGNSGAESSPWRRHRPPA